MDNTARPARLGVGLKVPAIRARRGGLQQVPATVTTSRKAECGGGLTGSAAMNGYGLSWCRDERAPRAKRGQRTARGDAARYAVVTEARLPVLFPLLEGRKRPRVYRVRHRPVALRARWRAAIPRFLLPSVPGEMLPAFPPASSFPCQGGTPGAQ